MALSPEEVKDSVAPQDESTKVCVSIFIRAVYDQLQFSIDWLIDWLIDWYALSCEGFGCL